MRKRFNLNERPFGGSMEPRLAPRFGDNGLNAKHGPQIPRAGIRETNTGIAPTADDAARRRRIGLSPRFVKD